MAARLKGTDKAKLLFWRDAGEDSRIFGDIW
jgi:hypothetical protein